MLKPSRRRPGKKMDVDVIVTQCTHAFSWHWQFILVGDTVYILNGYKQSFEIFEIWAAFKNCRCSYSPNHCVYICNLFVEMISINVCFCQTLSCLCQCALFSVFLYKRWNSALTQENTKIRQKAISRVTSRPFLLLALWKTTLNRHDLTAQGYCVYVLPCTPAHFCIITLLWSICSLW